MTTAIYFSVVIYFLAAFIIGMPVVLIWMHWAKVRIGLFWDYSLDKVMGLYYPRAWSFMTLKVYRVIAAVLWPIALPWMLTLWTRALKADNDFEQMMTRLVSR